MLPKQFAVTTRIASGPISQCVGLENRFDLIRVCTREIVVRDLYQPITGVVSDRDHPHVAQRDLLQDGLVL